jgi:hypothetical protein
MTLEEYEAELEAERELRMTVWATRLVALLLGAGAVWLWKGGM